MNPPDPRIDRVRRQIALARIRGDLVATMRLEQTLCHLCGLPAGCLCRRITPRRAA